MKETKIIETLKEGARFVGTSIGIILFAIGAVMFLQAILKLYVFNIKTDNYFDANFACSRFDPSVPQIMPDTAQPELKREGVLIGRADEQMDKESLEQKYQECIKKEEERASKRFVGGKKEDIADGVAFMLTGLLLAFAFSLRKNK